MNQSQFFEALADETRRRILVLVLRKGELCVCELVQALEISQPKASRHLAVLRDAELLTQRREGTWMHYRVNPQLPSWAYLMLGLTADGLEQSEPYHSDQQRLQQASKRQQRCAVDA